MNRKKLLLAGLGICFGTIAIWSQLRPQHRGGHFGARPELQAAVSESPPDSNTSAGPRENTAPPILTNATAAGGGTETWNRFRGPNGTGVSQDTSIPTAWSDTKNVLWRTTLPGAGSSSPILTTDFIFVTSYSGYGGSGSPGDPKQLQRHLTCVNRSDGAIVWSHTVAAVQPEDRYQGMGLPEHGYATNTPVTDGQSVFAFLGKSGVYAFDLKGTELWHVSVGTESGNREWGSAASLTLYGDLVIVNAAEESQTLLALDKATGKTVWKAPASTLELCYSTPAIARVNADREDLVLAVPGEVWGLNPLTGKLVWYAETTLTDNLSPSVIVDRDRIYAFGGYRSSGSLALKTGGKGDITQSHVDWTSKTTSYVATPVLLNERLYWIDDKGVYYCANAKTGDQIARSRVPGLSNSGRPVYASPIVINGLIYAQTRTNGLIILEPGDELKVVAHNTLESDTTQFNATPAVDAGQLFLRSDRSLYCIGTAKQNPL